MTTSSKRSAAAVLLSLLLGGCDVALAGGGHGVSADSDAEHGRGEAPSLVYTDYSKSTELFVEFPSLVVDQPSTFAAHVTRLADYAPLTSGTLDVVLIREGKTVARFRVSEPARRGIFTPAVTPRETGRFRLAIEVRDGDLQARHELGQVRVYPDAASVTVEQPPPQGEIRYLKEQQWNNSFATQAATRRPMRSSVPGFGTVQAPADASATIRAPSDGYYTTAELTTAGQSIQANALLGYLVPRLGEGSDIGNLMVEVERARTKLELAQRDVERLQRLVSQGAVPERRLSEARHNLEVARIELKTARSRIAQRSGESSEAGIALRAPVAGEVVAVNVRPGAFVRAGDSLFTVVDPSRRWFEIRVPEKYAEGLRQATGAWLRDNSRENKRTVVLDAENGARVVNINTVIEARSRTAEVTVEYPNSKGPTVIGARYPAHVLNGKAESRLAIPRTAIIDDGGRPVVYVQSGGETFERRTVLLGIVDGDLVEVESGVSAGERVVSKGAYYVKLAASSGDEIGHGHAH